MKLGRAKLMLPEQVLFFLLFPFFVPVFLCIAYMDCGTQQTGFVSSNVSNISTMLENQPSKEILLFSARVMG